MWTILAFAKSPSTKPDDLAGHGFTIPRGPVKCDSMLVMFYSLEPIPGSRAVKVVGLLSLKS